ncbi:MAG: hypothetical protein ACREJ3_20005, partial [Polyangiaceae bacterium]
IAFVREQSCGCDEASDAAPSLGLTVEANHVTVSLDLPLASIREALTRIAGEERALEVTAALAELPEQFQIDVSGGGTPLAASVATADDLRHRLGRVARGQAVVRIGWSVPRKVALEHAALLDEQFEDAVVAMVEVFALLAGAPEEPEDGTDRRTRSGRHSPGRRERTWAARTGDDSERRKERRGGVTDRPRLRAARSRRADSDRERRGPGPGVVAGAITGGDTGSGLGAGLGSGSGAGSAVRPRPGSGRPAAGRVLVSIDRGAHVRVLKGAFSGKLGVVQELDGKGGARVMLGLLALRLDVDNLVPATEGRARPRLSSSHRKPGPVRS